ncbi:ABC transporter permease [Blautia schinkii]|nr:ABC transporter permease [Blautia schinkii]
MSDKKGMKIKILQYMSFELFVIIFVMFGLFSQNWFTFSNFIMIIKQSSYVGILAIGITFPLITAGTDLSVGAVMFMGMSFSAMLLDKGVPLPVAMLVALIIGCVIGIVNAFFVVDVKVMPFIATLGTMTVIRGITLIFTGSRALNIPAYLTTAFGSGKLFGLIPYPAIVFIFLLLVFHIVLTKTAFGRRIFACGNNLEAAKKAGLNTRLVLYMAYVISGVLAAIAGFVSASQIGNVPAGFGEGYEFDAIAASVLGGTSLLGGTGSILPGVLVGAVTIQMIKTGLTAMQINPYLIDIFQALFILLAVMLDGIKNQVIAKSQSRHIRVAE